MMSYKTGTQSAIKCSIDVYLLKGALAETIPENWTVNSEISLNSMDI